MSNPELTFDQKYVHFKKIHVPVVVTASALLGIGIISFYLNFAQYSAWFIPAAILFIFAGIFITAWGTSIEWAYSHGYRNFLTRNGIVVARNAPSLIAKGQRIYGTCDGVGCFITKGADLYHLAVEYGDSTVQKVLA